MSLPKYPAYKDSGVEWVGDVPSGWVVDRLKASIISCKNGVWGQDALQDENDIPCVRVADFDRQKLSVSLQEPTIRNVLQKDRNERVLTKNNLLLEKSGGGENQLVGCVVLYEDENPAVCSNFVAKITIAPNMSPSYWRYVHFAIYSVRLNYCSIKQTSGIQNLDQDSYFNEKAPFPSFQEQTLIAQFLDRETAKIDDLIAEQEKLITLLDEKRQAMISHAVTKGLNPNAPMKDSCVEWLGEIPEHWEVKSLAKATNKITNGFVGPTRDILFEEGVPYIQATHIKQGRVNFGNDYFVNQDWSNKHAKSILKTGDVLIVQTGAGTGDVGLVSENEQGYNCHALIILQPIENQISGNYLSLVLQSDYGRSKLESVQTGAMHPHLNCGEVKFLFTPLPPFSEQLAIVSFINRNSSQFDSLKEEAQRGIELLKERRIALISAAVTGKIDVRHAVTEQVAT